MTEPSVAFHRLTVGPRPTASRLFPPQSRTFISAEDTVLDVSLGDGGGWVGGGGGGVVLIYYMIVVTAAYMLCCIRMADRLYTDITLSVHNTHACNASMVAVNIFVTI